MNLIEKMVKTCKGYGVNAKAVAEGKAEVIAKMLGCSMAEAEGLIAACGKLIAAAPAAADVSPWPDDWWQGFAGQLSKELQPTPAPSAPANPFGAAPAQVEAQRANGKPEAPTSMNLRATVLMAARRLKANNPEEFDSYSLNERALNGLVDGATKLFEGKNPSREAVEAYVRNEMESAADYRNAHAAIAAEAEKRGWKIAPRPKQGSPSSPTDTRRGIVGNADFKALIQAVMYDGLSVVEAFDGLGFTARGRSVPHTPAPSAPANPFGAAG